LSRWRGDSLPPHRIAESAFWLERQVLGFTGSLAAAYTATFGGICFLEFPGRGGPSRASSYGTVEQLAPLVLQIPVVAAHMGSGRPARDAVVGLRERWAAGERQVVEAYEMIAELAREGKKALLDGDWGRVGKLMNENAIVQSALSTVDPLSQQLAEAALEVGALGVRPLGAGECGSVVALHSRPEEVVRAWESVGAVILPVLAYEESADGRAE
jgi:galactokinase/mevalonate kinase-like predicted kinase